MSDMPVIGISMYLEDVRMSEWVETLSFYTPVSYCNSVYMAGGLPFMIPSLSSLTNHVDDLLRLIDGLIIIGGSDVNPDLYNEQPHEKTKGCVEARDLVESALLRRGLEMDIPILGICRGMQLLNVVQGGSLIQHIPDHQALKVKHQQSLGVFAKHPVETVEGTKLRTIYGNETQVFSAHHQALGHLGKGILVAARDKDGTIEGIELPSHDFVVGVQWHPEEDPKSQLVLFELLISHALQYRRELKNE